MKNRFFNRRAGGFRLRETSGCAAAFRRLGILLGLALLCGGKIFAADAAADFSAANELYARGQFADAAAAYEKILQTGGQSPALWFNCGNAEFKAGHPGKAIAAYRRAELLAPRDAELRANRPHTLASWAAAELARMPRYYIMDLAKNMAETVARLVPDAGALSCAWLPDEELRVYADEFSRTTFQGGLQWYRNATDPAGIAQLQAYAGRRIEVPCCFIAGASDWGPYQSPGALEAMAASACSEFRGTHMIEGAGHWVQQEQPAAVNELLLRFLERET